MYRPFDYDNHHNHCQSGPNHSEHSGPVGGCGERNNVEIENYNCDISPVPPPIAPVAFIPGCNTQEQMNFLRAKVNETINQWNTIQNNCYQALNRMVGAAVENDVYFGPDEVKYQNGYSSADGCPYYIVESHKTDKAGRPIRVRLELAYNNSTNNGVSQPIQDVSFFTNANAIITAATGQSGWVGPAMKNGCPLAGEMIEGNFVAGYTKHGELRVFPGNTTVEILYQNNMVDCIGNAIPIILDGEITEQAKSLTWKTSVAAIGQKSCNGHNVMFFAGNANAVGMQGITVANVLKEMGCTTAVITAIGSNTGISEGDNVGMMEFMGQYAAPATGYRNPKNYAFWVISKKPNCGWNNRFTSEIADLVQTYGQLANTVDGIDERINIAEGSLDKINATLLDHENRITDNTDEIASLNAEINEIQNEITKYDIQITNITNQLSTYENRLTNDEKQIEANKNSIVDINDSIAAQNDALNAEIQARKTGDTRLDTLISTETEQRTIVDQELQQQINDLKSGATDLVLTALAKDATLLILVST
ncbi:MAG: chromosome segregation ATPase [Circular genetic element sp.]|nr:MAG: chromosome segregation ATPase [Circular genetic element sp.]